MRELIKGIIENCVALFVSVGVLALMVWFMVVHPMLTIILISLPAIYLIGVFIDVSIKDIKNGRL